MKKIQKKDICFLFIAILISIVTYWNFIKIHYSTDIFRIINIGYKDYAINYSFTDGRFFMGIINLIGDFLKITPELYKAILTVLAIIVNSISVIKLKNIILKYKTTSKTFEEVIVFLIAFCTIFNFVQVEFLYYIECFVIAISILLIIYAAAFFINKNKKCYIMACLMCIFSVISYQATIPFFIGLVFTLSIIKNKTNYKEIFKDFIKSGVIVLIAVFINVLFVKVFTYFFNTSQTRINFSLDRIITNIKYIINNFVWIFINYSGLYINGLILLIFATIIILNLFLKTEQKNQNILNIFLIVCITVLANFAMHIPTLASYYCGRTKYAFATCVGLIFIYLYTRTEIFNKNNLIKTIATLIICIYFICNISNAVMLTTYHRQVNVLEKIEVSKIEEDINRYEENNNIKIQNIAIITIKNNPIKAYYEEIPRKCVVLHNSLKCDWAVDGIINFYTNKGLKKIKLNENEKTQYLSKFEDEKDYIFIHNTLVVKAYMY